MSSRCDPAYAEVIDRLFSFRALDQEAASVIGLSGDDRIIYLNHQWDDFAEANGGQPAIRNSWDLGASYMLAVPECLRPLYGKLLARARSDGEWARPVAHQYECSSPTLYRRFNMLVYGISHDSGVLIVNSLMVERPFLDSERPAHERHDGRYRDVQGIVHQCSHCRRVRLTDDPLVWHWVPEWVERSAERTSHDLCETCLRYFYPA